jgi:hypothetical protein
MLEKIKKLVLPKYLTTFKPMDYRESIRILSTNGSNESIIERYKILMRINHPDLGGSPYICAKLNEAKKYLMEFNRSLYN